MSHLPQRDAVVCGARQAKPRQENTSESVCFWRAAQILGQQCACVPIQVTSLCVCASMAALSTVVRQQNCSSPCQLMTAHSTGISDISVALRSSPCLTLQPSSCMTLKLTRTPAIRRAGGMAGHVGCGRVVKLDTALGHTGHLFMQQEGIRHVLTAKVNVMMCALKTNVALGHTGNLHRKSNKATSTGRQP